MKHFKKFLAFAVAVIMVIAMAMPVFATDTDPDEPGGDTPVATTKTITLTGGKAGHTYTLYQIFTGKVEDGELTNIQWGTGVNAEYQAKYATAAAAAKAIATLNDARATAQEIVGDPNATPAKPSYLGTALKTVELEEDGDVVFANIPEGYYLIVDTNGNEDPVEGDYNSAYIVEVVKDVEGEIKGDAPTSDKTVADPESETGAASTTDAAAYNIGDAVPFQLSATTADNVAAYKKYHITFQDKQSEGLDAPESFTVKVLGLTFTVPADGADPAAQTTAKGTKVTVTKETPASGNTFAIKVEFEPTAEGKEYLDAECNATDITVDYTAVLNSSAEVGLPGNPNESYIEYSNNPEDEDGGDEGKTPPDDVVVFTYKTVIDKVDGDGKPLEGAGFTIYKEVEQGTAGAVKGSDIEFAAGVEHSKIDDDKYYVVKAMTTVSGNNAQFEFKGLADGDYVLVETTIPEGFNAFKSVVFTITSAVTDGGENGTPTITQLEGTTPFTSANPGADEAVASGNHKLDSGEVYGQITNNSGQTLPSTGGIGRTIFYVLGTILVLGAAVVLIARNRASKAR